MKIELSDGDVSVLEDDSDQAPPPILTPLKKVVEEVTKIESDHTIELPTHVVRTGYNEKVFEYIKSDSFQYEIAKSIDDARWKRAERKRFTSLREADILARGNIRLVAGSTIDMMLMDEGGTYMLCEGTPGCIDSGWHFRLRYNNGLTWIEERVTARNFARKNGRDSDACTIDIAIEKGRESLGAIRSQLDELLLPLWDDEVDGGFMPFLLKPEFMTAKQYMSVAASRFEINSEEFIEMLDAVG